MRSEIRFSAPFVTGKEFDLVAQCLAANETSGDGQFSKRCEKLMQDRFSASRILLTNSCTAALEISALLAGVGPGDEVIMPSYTFVSTANAFFLRGAIPKFVDIRPDTLNIDERWLADAVTPRTKAIVPVHYAGVSCDMDRIRAVARQHDLLVIEDAAQAVNATYKSSFLGTIGDLGAYSFHATKNYSCGEGGALLVNDSRLLERAEALREKGTNRSRFYRGEVDKYTWVDVGSSYVLSDLLAAVLLAQLEAMTEITEQRKRIYERYLEGLAPLASRGLVKLPTVPAECGTNYHLFFVIVESLAARTALIDFLKSRSIGAPFHYVPLHTSPMGLKLGYEPGSLPVTETVADRLVRLPLYAGLPMSSVEVVIDSMLEFYGLQRCARHEIDTRAASTSIDAQNAA
jgi:dTDP-4-amino-4,6-dideoxygalactose transaminase